MFNIQTRNFNGKWATPRFSRPVATLPSAIASACALDQDGLFLAGVRIINAAGEVVLKGDNKPADHPRNVK